VNRGSWFAQQGGSGLPCRGLLPDSASIAGRSTGVSAGVFRSSPHPTTQVDDPLSDALDELLGHAQASLKHLDYLQAKAKSYARPESGSERQRQPLRRRDSGSSSFWNPRCHAHLWSEDLDFGDAASTLSSDDSEDDDVAWSFLNAAAAAEASRPSRPTPWQKVGGNPSEVPVRAQGPPLPRAPPSSSSRAPSHQPPRPQDSGTNAAGACPPPAQHRGQRPGFRFGVAGQSAVHEERPEKSAAHSRPPGQQTVKTADVCAQVTSALESAKGTGSQATKSILRQLLLQWHPDKAPQGEDPLSVAARCQATDVMRFILKERERLHL